MKYQVVMVTERKWYIARKSSSYLVVIAECKTQESARAIAEKLNGDCK